MTRITANLTKDIESLQAKLVKAQHQISGVIFGQEDIIDLTLTALLSGGHVLLLGMPGLAKTTIVKTLGTVFGLDVRRLQCTPDLMPADVLGSEVLEEGANGTRAFKFIKGPVFSQVLIADEINRASPRTQSALLQAMQEHRVSVAGQDYDLPAPFHVLATQNPIEHEGTYPLPEAQLDRFLLQVEIRYPQRAAERQTIVKTTGEKEPTPKKVLTAEDLLNAQKTVRILPIGNKVVDAILTLVRATRPETSDNKLVKKYVSWGGSPRAGQALMLTVRARALLQGRLSPSVDDVVALAKPVLKHRMALHFAARAENISLDSIIDDLCASLK